MLNAAAVLAPDDVVDRHTVAHILLKQAGGFRGDEKLSNKEKADRAYSRFGTQAAAAELLGVCERTLGRWVIRYLEGARDDRAAIPLA